MSAHHYPSGAWGGVQVDAYYGGGTPGSALCPSSAHAVQAQWDDGTEIPHEQFCAATSSKTNAQCRAYKVKGTHHCHFHGMQMKRKALRDGAEP